MSANHDEGAGIISRMRELRSTGQSDVNQLHAQAERVTDWREHDRAQPALSAIASAVVGYAVVRGLAGNASSGHPSASAQPVQFSQQKSSSKGILSLVGGIALNVGRQWVTEYLKKQLGGHAHVANQSAQVQQRSNANSGNAYP